MIFTPSDRDKTITLGLTDQEWTIFRFMTRINGATFLKNYIESFFTQRQAQKLERRKEIISNRFNELSAQEQQQVLNIMEVDFGDE